MSTPVCLEVIRVTADRSHVAFYRLLTTFNKIVNNHIIVLVSAVAHDGLV